MTEPAAEIQVLVGVENAHLLLEALKDVFRTGYGQVRLEISNGRVQTIKTEVSRKAELQEHRR